MVGRDRDDGGQRARRGIEAQGALTILRGPGPGRQLIVVESSQDLVEFAVDAIDAVVVHVELVVNTGDEVLEPVTIDGHRSGSQ